MSDHVALAIEGIDSIDMRNDPFVWAQVHATLAVAEQQRIANLIAYWQLHTPRSSVESYTDNMIEVPSLHTEDDRNVEDEIRAALGID